MLNIAIDVCLTMFNVQMRGIHDTREWYLVLQNSKFIGFQFIKLHSYLEHAFSQMENSKTSISFD